MKIKILLIFCLFFINCKKAESQTTSKNSKSSISRRSSVKVPSCEEIVRQIVISSNLNLSVYKGNYQISIEEIKNNIIKIHVFTENNISDNPKQKQIVESTIAWLVFLPNEQRLLNITADPDYPTELKFDENILKSNDVFKICNILKKENNSPLIDKTEKNCKKISGEMMSGEECIFKNTQIEKIYDSIINEKLVDDSDFLLKKNPESNQIIEVNKNGLISIEYKIVNNKLNIEMLYDGGTTEIKLEQVGQNVKRNIVYNAD